MQVIISMAGIGQRFKDRGFETPKHLLKAGSKTLIELSIDSLNIKSDFYFILRKNNEINNDDLKKLLYKNYNGCTIIEIDYVTEGPASSAYLAKDFLDKDKELIITNCDQVLEWDAEKFLKTSRDKSLDCSVLTYNSNNPKNSFILCDQNDIAIDIQEKNPISNLALVGLHYFKKADFFIKTYEEIFAKNIRTNNEFYISHVCNNLIKTHKVGHVLLDDNEYYHSTGTPDCYFKYLRHCGLLEVPIYNLNDMYRGWFIGDFEPAVSKQSGFEVGYLCHKKGEKWQSHIHKNLYEVNLLVHGKMILNDTEINENEIFIINQNIIASPIFLEDCYILCVKIPKMVGDKTLL